MKAFLRSLFVVALLTTSFAAVAEDKAPRTVSTYDVALDVALRPASFIGMIVGTGLFVGLAPFTAISQAFPPHDSFDKMARLLIVQPAYYTFSRPVGDYTHPSDY